MVTEMIERKHQFIETELLEWKDIFKLSDKLLKQFVFRGQADKNWAITSSLERLINRLHPNFIDTALIPSQEIQMLKEFQWKYQLFKTKSINEDDFVEWLSIMQHYGASTRLIDFTNSFYVSAFMAVFESSADSAVWAINTNVISSNTFDSYREKFNFNSIPKQNLDKFSLELANNSIKNSLNEKEKKLLLIYPNNCNERLYRQQGLFIMPTNIQVTFMENLNPFLSSNKPLFIDFKNLVDISDSYKQDLFTLIKINIPQKNHLSILRSLREMNINSEILFPGIEGLAKSLNYSKFNSY